jgi:transposase
MGKKKKTEETAQPKKTSRSDVKDRKELNKDTEFTCVKTSFNSLVENNYLSGGIQEIVLNINKICFLSYQLLNYHFTRLIEENKPLPEITQSLFYQACATVSVMKERKEKIDETDELYISFSHYKEHVGELPFRDRMGNLINNLNRQQLTMTENHLKLNFYKRFHKYLEIKTGETRKGVIYKWLKDIYAIEYSGKNFFILSMRQWLKYPPTEVNIKMHSSHFVKIYHKILKTFEKYPYSKHIRTFNLLPTKNSFTLSTIEICSSCLKDIIGYFTKTQVPDDFKENKLVYWYEFFKIEKYETKTRKFANTIYTDGKIAVIRLRKPKFEAPKPKDVKKIQYEQYVGIDPGVRSLQTSCNNEGRVLETTTPSYRHDCKMKYACRKREMWYKKWEHYEMWRNIPSFKTTNLQKMRHYFEYVYPNLNTIFKFHLYKNFRGLSFRSYCRGKATMDKLCKSIVDDKKTLVGFGDFSQQHGLVKKHPTAPIQKFKHELRRYCDVIIIDEYNTSKTCNKCFQPIELYKNKIIRKKRDGTHSKARMSIINSVIRCKLNECKLCCMDRDINASKNILFLLQLQKEGKKRPECFNPKNMNDCDTPLWEDKYVVA